MQRPRHGLWPDRTSKEGLHIRVRVSPFTGPLKAVQFWIPLPVVAREEIHGVLEVRHERTLLETAVHEKIGSALNRKQGQDKEQYRSNRPADHGARLPAKLGQG